MSIEKDLAKIEHALELARETVSKYTSGRIQATLKDGGDPVTEADVEIDKVLRKVLLEDGEGWLSEETVDNNERLNKHRVWIVDPIDGTREFVAGIPEWCISIGLVEDGKAIAGGICNPAADELYLGSVQTGVTLNSKKVTTSKRSDLSGATVLASRSEVNRGEWEQFMAADLKIIPMGSVAYKLARISAGLDDITFTLVPKNEWDIAAGVALVNAAGGKLMEKEKQPLVFNREKTLISGLIASGPNLFEPLLDLIGIDD
ncbi:MAG: 3'(2'),5'-bisphosphate nucleotidase CysQ [Sedimentisphaerales bacterium]|nr:3'(2'),5'-bisphosphate nucleotidase CysQ [Sedimentisphaerales bacterium]